MLLSILFIACGIALELAILHWIPESVPLIFVTHAVLCLRIELIAHEGWHGTISKNRRLNRLLTAIANFLAMLDGKKVAKLHWQHHRPSTSGKGDDNARDLRFESRGATLSFIGAALAAWGLGWVPLATLLLAHIIAIKFSILLIQFFLFNLQHSGERFAHTHNFVLKNRLLNFIFNPYNFGLHDAHHEYPYRRYSELPKLAAASAVPTHSYSIREVLQMSIPNLLLLRAKITHSWEKAKVDIEKIWNEK